MRENPWLAWVFGTDPDRKIRIRPGLDRRVSGAAPNPHIHFTEFDPIT